MNQASGGYVVEVVEVQAGPLAVVRATTRHSELATTIRSSLDQVWAFLRVREMGPLGHNVVVYLDGVMNVEIGVQVAEPFVGEGAVVCSQSPNGVAIHTPHFGPYERIGEANAALRAWALANGRELAGPSWEVYGDWTEDLARLRTDIYYLLKS